MADFDFGLLNLIGQQVARACSGNIYHIFITNTNNKDQQNPGAGGGYSGHHVTGKIEGFFGGWKIWHIFFCVA